MKILLLCVSLLVSKISFGASCEGAIGKSHTNPDASIGGFVAETAKATSTVFLDASSSVCEQSQVQGNAKVISSSVIKGRALVEGNSSIVSSTIKGSAKVFGGAEVVNSSVCQQSVVNFKVSNSNYYCSIFEPEPKDPGQLGRETLAGLDANVNGIRDDIEIWINNNTSNTEEKNLDSVRARLLSAGKNLGEAIILSQNGKVAKDHYRQSMRDLSCVTSLKDKNLAVLSSKLKVIVFNTESRLNAWIKVQGTFAGDDVEDLNGYCD